MANELVTGTVIVRIDGISIRSKEGATLQFGGAERTPQFADGRLIGFSKKPSASMVTATLVHTSISDIDKLNNIEDASLAFECDSGPVYVIAGCFATKPPELTADGDGVKVEYCGQPAQAAS